MVGNTSILLTTASVWQMFDGEKDASGKDDNFEVLCIGSTESDKIMNHILVFRFRNTNRDNGGKYVRTCTYV